MSAIAMTVIENTNNSANELVVGFGFGVSVAVAVAVSNPVAVGLERPTQRRSQPKAAPMRPTAPMAPMASIRSIRSIR